jgi:hypothetical protein
MFRDDDFGLLDVRQVALGFPCAFEKISWGRPVFCAPKIFVMYDDVAQNPPFAQVDSGLRVCQQTS